MTRGEEGRRQVDEDEIQRFIDSRLPAARREVVDAFLSEHPDEARAVREQMAQRDALRAALRFKLDEPIPPRLRPDRVANARQNTARRAWAIAASLFVGALIGAGGGWFGRDVLEARQANSVADAAWRGRAMVAASAHRVFVADAFRPVEIYATAGDLVVRWLSNRLGHTVQAPDLGAAGFRFIGGRLIPTPEGAGGQLMYDDAAGLRATLFMVPAAGLGAGQRQLRFEALAGLDTASWGDGRFLYTLVAATDRARLEALAAAARAGLPSPVEAPLTRS